MKQAFEFMWTQVNAWVQILPPHHRLLPKVMNVRIAIEELLAEAPQPTIDKEINT